MDNLNLISNFAEFKELKNIDKSTMIGVLEDVFRHALQKHVRDGREFRRHHQPREGRPRNLAQPHRRRGRRRSRIPIRRSPCRRSRPLDPTYESRRRIGGRRDQTRLVRPPRRACRCAKTWHRASSTWRRPASTRSIRRTRRRDCHRRSLPGVEKGGARSSTTRRTN